MTASRRRSDRKKTRRMGLPSSTNVKNRPEPSSAVTERQNTSHAASRCVKERRNTCGSVVRQDTSWNAKERLRTSWSVKERHYAGSRRSRRTYMRRTRSYDRAGGYACQQTRHRLWTWSDQRRRPRTRRVRTCLNNTITFSRRSPSGARCQSSKDLICGGASSTGAAPVVCNDYARPVENPPEWWLVMLFAWGDEGESRRLVLKANTTSVACLRFQPKGDGKEPRV